MTNLLATIARALRAIPAWLPGARARYQPRVKRRGGGAHESPSLSWFDSACVDTSEDRVATLLGTINADGLVTTAVSVHYRGRTWQGTASLVRGGEWVVTARDGQHGDLLTPVDDDGGGSGDLPF